MIEENKKNKIIIIVAAISGILVIALALFFYYGKSGRKEIGKDYSVGDLLQQVSDSKTEGRDLSIELSEINKNYKDAVAWLKIPGTSIDSPIFRSEDNERYLRNDRDNKKTRWGENFLDYTCNIKSIGNDMQHIIVYGHNTEVDTRFTPLLNYKNADFYDKHKIIEFATLEKTYKFQIFSTYKTTTDFYYITTDFRDKTEYSDFINILNDKREYNTNVEVSENDTILTLSTCDYSVKNGRYVVHAKLMEE